MTDKLTPSQRSKNMGRIRSKNTSPEMKVRRMAHRLGYRFRLHRKDLPGKPDLLFPRKKKVIFVHGCFWHQHSDIRCKISRLPKSRPEYWIPKLKKTVERDARHRADLANQGWEVFLIWECDTGNSRVLAKRLDWFLSDMPAW